MSKTLALAVSALLGVSSLCDLERGLTQHFQDWFKANGYDSQNFARTDLTGGAYGGKASDTDTIVNTPIIFSHGNSDVAVGAGTPLAWQTGFTQSINYLLGKGYKKSEMYITTWGDGNSMNAYTRVHSADVVLRLRKFVEAVLAYTGVPKVHIIAHSMGVTLARKVIKGGALVDGGDAGAPLTSKVDTFVGLAGANRGLMNCYYLPAFATCGNKVGFYPGSSATSSLSDFLADINNSPAKEGDYVFSIFSTMDDLISYGDLVWGQYTSAIPGQTDQKVLTSYEYNHMGCRDKTLDLQYQAITKHSLNQSEQKLIIEADE